MNIIQPPSACSTAEYRSLNPKTAFATNRKERSAAGPQPNRMNRG